MRFDNFKIHSPILRQKVATLWEWLSGEHKTGLFITGPCGTGKTHLAVSLLRELIKAREGVCFLSVSAFSLKCQGAFTEDTTPAEIIRQSLTRFIVLDDLCSDTLSRDYVTPLIEAAYNGNRVLIATSNLGLKAMNDNNPRIASRLSEMCRILEFVGDDYRLRIAKERR